MQSSKNSSVVSGGPFAGMFDMVTENADDNAPGIKNSEIKGLYTDVNKKTYQNI